jgi:hypothetical protein
MFRTAMRSLLWAAVISAGAHASAETATFEFCGHTIGTNPMARDGTPVVGRFSWDTSAAGSIPYAGAPQSYYEPPAIGPFSFLVGRHRVTAENTSAVVFNDAQSTLGNVSDMIDINAQAPVVDGTLFQNGYFSIRLAGSPQNTSVLADTSLPSRLDVAKFDGFNMNYFQMYSGVVANDLMLDVKLDWIQRAGEARRGESARRLCLPQRASR